MARAIRRGEGHPLINEAATSAPRAGRIGVLPVDELDGEARQSVRLELAVHCPDCSNYGRIVGTGSDFRNITKLVEPMFQCSVCSWGPAPGQSPEMWAMYYAGRLGGTLVFAMNEEHMEILVGYLETPPHRRKRVQFPWEYKALMAKLPHDITSGRMRNDMVSLIKRLQRTKPHGV